MAGKKVVALQDARRTDADPIVLLHGLTASARVWDKVTPHLAPHPVLMPTLPGHRGGPPLARGSVTMEGIVDGVCAQLDSAGINRAHIVGNSLGGWVAIELARRGRAVSVVAFSPAGGWTRAADLRRLVRVMRVAVAVGSSAAGGRLARRPIGRRVLFGRLVANPSLISRYEATEMLNDLIECSIAPDLLAGALHEGPLRRFSVAPCPVLLAWGDRDRLTPYARLGVRFVQAIPGIVSTTLPGVGHVPMSDDPALVAETIRSWVDAVEPATGRAVRAAAG
jgi:pimeloyl-ACP methyl ester carboxylesterase